VANIFGAIFPGQGSQHPGMGKFLAENFKEARVVFEEASEAIKFDLQKLCFDGSDEDLALTKNTQPALLTVSTATFRVMNSLTDFKPIAGAGHSIGEYAALVTSNALSLSDAVRAVRRRGEAMQEAVPVGTGAMAAVMGLDSKQVIELCKFAESKTGEKPLEPANFNCPGQIVISGKKSLVDWIAANLAMAVSEVPTLTGSRIKIIPLKVSAPFHCSLMYPAEKVMRDFLENNVAFKDAAYPVIQNFVATPVTSAQTLRENVIRQISAPVRWIECVEQLRGLNATKLVEFGSGKVLNGLVKKIDSERLQTFNLNSLEEVKALEQALT
jgi:[acyl-carrier-protein] S-malonyltransferase